MISFKGKLFRYNRTDILALKKENPPRSGNS
jgi:hypothetical protein